MGGPRRVTSSGLPPRCGRGGSRECCARRDLGPPWFAPAAARLGNGGGGVLTVGVVGVVGVAWGQAGCCWGWDGVGVLLLLLLLLLLVLVLVLVVVVVVSGLARGSA